MKLLVTGGAGFIGSNFILYFLKAHPQSAVVNLDKLTYAGNLENLTEVDSNPNYRFVQGDICDAALLQGLFKDGFDAVVHFAAETHVDRSIANARDFIQTNVMGTYCLLEAARQCRTARFLHVSTDEVYGSVASPAYSDEEWPLRPNSPYAASKASSDLLVRSYWQTHRFPVLITRCSNNYGPRQFPEKLIPLMITNALEGKRLPVYGDGLNERDWIYVEDHCRGIDAVLHSGRAGEVYNIGAGQPSSNLDIIRRLLKLLGKSEDLIEFVTDRPGHDRRYAVDIAKARKQLHWQPAVDLEQGLAGTINWYLEHPEWVARTKSGDYKEYYERFYTNRDKSLRVI
jgi:dTDP-glucose 4,6-dehydratase